MTLSSTFLSIVIPFLIGFRFDRWADRRFFIEKSRETYSMFYNWSYTNRPGGRPTERVSGVYARLVKEGGVFSFRNGWEVRAEFLSHFLIFCFAPIFHT